MSIIKPESCRACLLYQNGCGFSEPEGLGSLGVLVIAEASGEAEERDGLPFRPHAAAGSLLERCFRRCGWSREQFRITNVIRCRPPFNKLDGEEYEHSAIANCQHFLDDVIEEMKPRCILALGGIAARTLTGMAGHKQGISSIRGFVLNSPRYHIPVVCSLHPAFLRRGYMKYMGILIRDMQLAVQVAQQGPPIDETPASYLEQPTAEQAAGFAAKVLANPDLLIAYDIETNYSHEEDEDEVSADTNQITLVQFSHGPGKGIAMPWASDFIPHIKAILGSANPKLGFNVYHFDNPKLREAGVEVSGNIHDVMWAWHALQPDLPRGLQSVASFFAPEFGPWKHTSGMDLANYGCKDVDILQRIWPRLSADMQRHGVWDCYERHVRQLWPILERMSQRGLPIDAERQAAFRLDLESRMATVDAELQEIYPAHLKEVSPKKGFVRAPKDTANLVQIEVLAKVPCKVPCSCVDSDGVITGWNKKVALRCARCKGKGLVKGEPVEQLIQRWARPLPFKPSPPQLIRYMHYRKHKVPKVIGGDRETTSKLFIERMSRDYKDPLYKGLLEYRSIQKFKGSYLWAPAADGRVHAEFKFSPATGQLAASNPNVLTIPTEYKAGPMAKVFRECIRARPGHVLVEVDVSGFHTSTFALEAQDPAYFRLANVIRDPHSFLAAVMLKQNTPEQMLAMHDAELLAYLTGIKKAHKSIRDGQAKPAILGYALGLGGNKLFEMNRFDPLTGAGFASKREAEQLIGTLRQCFPRGYQYQQEIRAKAQRQGYLLNRHGYIRRFWDVLRPNAVTGEGELGEQANEAAAFDVQADAHGHLKEMLLEMQALGWLERYNLINVVHDSVVFEVAEELLEECLTNVCALMEQPSKVLRDPVLCPDGLVVGVEAKWGPDLANVKGWKRGAAK